VRYEVLADPLIVHCCHCRYCQRQTGSAFVLNALLQAEHVVLTSGTVNEVVVPSPSGQGQKIARCPECGVALWSNYHMGGIREMIRFVRVGTLDDPDLLPPDVHIYTGTKQPWVVLPPGSHVVEEFYDYDETWTRENREIGKALLEKAGELGRRGWE
jgi:hypothetical protein